MEKTFTHLNQQTRDRIKALLDSGCSARKIGRTLGIPHTTISREIKRNSYSRTLSGRWQDPAQLAKRGTYDPTYAQHKAYIRRRQAPQESKKLHRFPALQDFVIIKLAAHWNPDEIAGYLKRHRACLVPCAEDGCGLPYVSKTTIYEWLTTTRGEPYRKHLYQCRATGRKRNPAARGHSHIPDRVPLHERPASAMSRQEPGHWEGDTIVSGAHTGSHAALVVLVERTTRLVAAQLVPDMRPAGFAVAASSLLKGKQVRTLSLDNGIENKNHRQITEATGAAIYFTDPYSSWQKGGVENANRMIRRYIPKGSDLSKVTQTEVDTFVECINKKPRRCLGYKSALELAAEKGVLM